LESKSKFSFAGKHVLLTGAGGGLGTALALDLAEMGAFTLKGGRNYV
jgi:NAD(P)-dependent dehydrogenase (short-subunit alcohol dehydrogenase family)